MPLTSSPDPLAIIGAGRVGTALAVLLARAGHRISAVSGGERTRGRAERFLPGVPLLAPAEAARAAVTVVLGVPDDRIAATCAELAGAGAFASSRFVVHLSGSVPLVALDPARDAGAVVFSLHPLQTAPTVEDAIERLPGSGMAVTAWEESGYATGERLARDAGGRPFRIADGAKPLYHAAAVFASNSVAVVAALAERLFREAGVEDPVPLFAPLTQATADNVARLGPAAALTGPAVRGDAGTIDRNLQAIRSAGPDVVAAYIALTRIALDLAEGSGRLDAAARKRVEEVLDEWR
jgi:predicted short-subunit dehydrogenase-like oxidoreductase (DUF2520 family)